MDIEFKCDKCGQQIIMDEAGVGEPVQCPSCRKWIVVSAPNSVPASTPTRKVFRRETVRSQNDVPLSKQSEVESALEITRQVILLLSIVATVSGLCACAMQNSPDWLPFAVGVFFAGIVQNVFFRWASEVLGTLRKIADEAHNSRLCVCQNDRVSICAECGCAAKPQDTYCPACKRVFLPSTCCKSET